MNYIPKCSKCLKPEVAHTIGRHVRLCKECYGLLNITNIPMTSKYYARPRSKKSQVGNYDPLDYKLKRFS